VTQGSRWRPGFFEELESSSDVEDTVDEMLKGIAVQRSSKRPVRL
jgi:hypothetical protein